MLGVNLLARLGRAGAVVTVATTAANLLAYLAPLLGARQLAAADFSALATVLALCAVFGVPSQGLQTAVAVRVARGERMSTTRLGLATAAVTSGVLLLLGPLLVANLYLGWNVIVLTAALVFPVVVCGGWLGVLQGQHLFGRLAIGMILLGLARFAGIITGILLGQSVTGILLLGVAGSMLGVLPIMLLVPRDKAPAPGRIAREVWACVLAMVAMLVMSYMDVIAARHLLSPVASAEYAVLSVLTKGAMWAPQVVTVLALPHLAARRRHALTLATAATAVVGAILVAAATLFSELALRFAGGAQYVHLASYAPVFAVTGAAYALAFLFINTRIAYGAKYPSWPAWLAVGGFAAAVLLLPTPSIQAIVTCAATSALVCLLISAGTLMWRGKSAKASACEPAPQPPIYYDVPRSNTDTSVA